MTQPLRRSKEARDDASMDRRDLARELLKVREELARRGLTRQGAERPAVPSPPGVAVAMRRSSVPSAAPLAQPGAPVLSDSAMVMQLGRSSSLSPSGPPRRSVPLRSVAYGAALGIMLLLAALSVPQSGWVEARSATAGALRALRNMTSRRPPAEVATAAPEAPPPVVTVGPAPQPPGQPQAPAAEAPALGSVGASPAAAPSGAPPWTEGSPAAAASIPTMDVLLLPKARSSSERRLRRDEERAAAEAEAAPADEAADALPTDPEPLLGPSLAGPPPGEAPARPPRSHR